MKILFWWSVIRAVGSLVTYMVAWAARDVVACVQCIRRKIRGVQRNYGQALPYVAPP